MRLALFSQIVPGVMDWILEGISQQCCNMKNNKQWGIKKWSYYSISVDMLPTQITQC